MGVLRRRGSLLLCALCLAVVWLTLLWARGAFLPSSADRSETVFLKDSSPLQLTLKRGCLSVDRNGTEVWRAESSWHVQDCLTMDIDRDGAVELLLLVWRRGNYGPSLPFWVKRNDTRWTQHIFIYNWQDGTFVPQWMSSQLRPKVACWSAQSADELFILTTDGDKTLWQWGQWGLVRTDG